MRLIYPDVGNCRALIIDSNATLRGMQALMLREMGVGHLTQASRVSDARRMLETKVFDVVLCDYHFDNDDMTGQDLLDDLRRANLLPYSTVFIMVTGEASYAMVAEAAESALDSYLLKPHTASALELRLLQARQRKTMLRTIFEAIEAGDFERGAALCRERFAARAEYWLYAARIGAELCLRLGHHVAARALYLAVHETSALPWARLGIARTQLEAGQINQAGETLTRLIDDHPVYADAHDMMGRVQLEQGDLDAALEAHRSAVRITPQSIVRLQKQGMLAFYMGALDEAAQALERSVRLGLGSKMFDAQGLVLLALMHFDKRDPKAFQRNHDNLALLLERDLDSKRLQRFVATSSVFKALIERRSEACAEPVQRLAAGIADEDFDFETASNLLAILSRVRGSDAAPPQSDTWITEIAQRFCVSKASSEMLCKAVQGHGPHEALIRAGHAQITRLAEEAMAHSLGGSPAAAVNSLTTCGTQTLNAKLIDLAGMVLKRHADKIDGSAAMVSTIAELQRRFCGRGAHVALGGGTARAAGALTIRA